MKVLGKVKIAGAVIVTVSAAFQVIAQFSPQRLTNARLGFGFFFINEVRFELIVLLSFGILLLLPASMWLSLWHRVYQVVFKSGSRFVLLVIVAIVGLYFISPYVNRVRMSRQYYYEQLIYRGYRWQIIKKGIEFEENHRFGDAIVQYRAVTDAFPDDMRNWWLKDRIKRMENVADHSRFLAQRALAKERARGLHRESFFLLVEALRLDATNEYLHNEVQRRMNGLEKIRHLPKAFYLACSRNDYETASAIFDKNSSYLFEDQVLDDMLRGPFGKVNEFSIEAAWEVLKHLSVDDFERMVETSWRFPWVREVLEHSLEYIKKGI